MFVSLLRETGACVPGGTAELCEGYTLYMNGCVVVALSMTCCCLLTTLSVVFICCGSSTTGQAHLLVIGCRSNSASAAILALDVQGPIWVGAVCGRIAASRAHCRRNTGGVQKVS